MNLAEYQAVVGSTAQEFAETGLSVHQLFQWQIKKQNEMYELPINVEPTLEGLGESPLVRMQGFMKTLQKEMQEGQEILAVLHVRENLVLALNQDGTLNTTKVEDALIVYGVEDAKRRRNISDVVLNAFLTSIEELDRQILVMLADWLGDMTVYNRSEALKYGIPLESVLACIMGSNFTKLGEDGMPIKDDNGKFLKGPNFVAPEGAIYATMFERDELAVEANTLVEAAAAVSALTLPVLMDPMADVLFLEGEEEEIDPDWYDSSEEGVDEFGMDKETE